MAIPRNHSAVLFGSVRDTPAATWNRDVTILRARDVACTCGAAIGLDCFPEDPRPYCPERLQIVRDLADKGEVRPEVQPYVPQSAAAAVAFNPPVAAKGGAPSKLTPQQVHAMLREKDAGKTTRQLAQEYGVSKATVSRLAAENRPAGYEQPRTLSNEHVVEAVGRFAAGEKWAGIADSLGVKQDTLETRVRRYRQAHS